MTPLVSASLSPYTTVVCSPVYLTFSATETASPSQTMSPTATTTRTPPRTRTSTRSISATASISPFSEDYYYEEPPMPMHTGNTNNSPHHVLRRMQ